MHRGAYHISLSYGDAHPYSTLTCCTCTGVRSRVLSQTLGTRDSTWVPLSENSGCWSREQGEKNQFSPRAPLSASTSLCPNAGAIPLFLFLPSVLPNKAHSPPQHTQDTNTLPPLNLLLVQCSCQFQVLVVLKSDYAEGTIPHLRVSRGPPNIHTCNHPPSLPPKDRFRNHMVSLASCAAMQFSFICSNSQWEFVLSITTFCLL